SAKASTRASSAGRGSAIAASADRRAGFGRSRSNFIEGEKKRQPQPPLFVRHAAGWAAAYLRLLLAAEACAAAALTASVFAANFWRNFSTRPASTVRVC